MLFFLKKLPGGIKNAWKKKRDIKDLYTKQPKLKKSLEYLKTSLYNPVKDNVKLVQHAKKALPGMLAIIKSKVRIIKEFG